MWMLEARLNFQWKKLRLNSSFTLPKLIGHRGVKDLKPENTLQSISKAFDLGLKCVEVDVKISKDNIPLLLHDDTLNRTTNGSGLVCDYKFDEINQLDAGYYFYKSKTDMPRGDNKMQRYESMSVCNYFNIYLVRIKLCCNIVFIILCFKRLIVNYMVIVDYAVECVHL